LIPTLNVLECRSEGKRFGRAGKKNLNKRGRGAEDFHFEGMQKSGRGGRSEKVKEKTMPDYHLEDNFTGTFRTHHLHQNQAYSRKKED